MPMNRRSFLGCAGAATAAAFLKPSTVWSYSANGRVNVALIGTAGIGESNRRALDAAGANIVALCDVDANRLGQVAQKHPKAKRWRDFRRMLEKQSEIDAVMVSTPDHVHAPAAMAAMEAGKHVSCEKPLTHNVYEARRLAEAAERFDVVTQMDNEGHSEASMRRLVEWVRAGALGAVREVHIITNRPIWPQGMKEMPPSKSAPDQLEWDLWLGPAPKRAFHEGLHPFKWRGWWDFGTGALGDMGCHFFDAPFWALELGQPETVEAEHEGNTELSAPNWSIVTYEFPARLGGDGKELPPVTLKWYDGGKHPSRPEGLPEDVEVPGNGSVFVGEKGVLVVDGTSDFRLYPESRREAWTAPEPSLPRAPDNNHKQDWLQAIQEGRKAGCDFARYGGPLAEVVLLGNVAIRAGERIHWDAEALRATNLPEADRYIRRSYRKGWEL